MNDIQKEAVAALEKLQKKEKERSAQWMVGEQLKDICRCEPASAELILRAAGVSEMGLKEAEKKIKAYADSHKTGNFACVTPSEADAILREFYGLPPKDVQQTEQAQAEGTGNIVNLFDFLN